MAVMGRWTPFVVLLALIPLSSGEVSTAQASSSDRERSATPSHPLSFISKNAYSSFHSRAPMTLTSLSLEPHRGTYFTACSSALEVEDNLALSAPKEDALYKELRDLAERGSNNEDMLRGKIDGSKRRFKEAREVEAEVGGYLYTWVIDGVEHSGRTVGPVEWSHEVSEVHIKLHRMSKENKETQSYEVTLPVRHVRRGLGELRASDRKKFFESVGEMYEVGTEEVRVSVFTSL